MILFEEPHLKIEFRNVPCRILVSTWTGQAPGSYKESIQTILQCCRENDVRKLVSDIRLQELPGEHEKKAVKSAFEQYTTKNGRLYVATIVAGEIFMNFSTENFGRATDENLYVNQFFSNELEAILWLQNADQ